MRKSVIAILSMAGLMAAGAVAYNPPAGEPGAVTLERLRGNSGITLQWIGWEDRGVVMVRDVAGDVHLAGGQIALGGAGTLWLDGKVVEAGADYFVFEGLIRIANTPDSGRVCEDTRRWRFAITQNRKYYRLREFEWCDRLTDYIDIYF